MEKDTEPTITVEDGYNRNKTPVMLTLRKCTIDDLQAMAQGKYYGTIKMLDKNGKARDIRPNGSMQTWKKDATRFERGFKYGMYETFRLDTQQMLNELLFPID